MRLRRLSALATSWAILGSIGCESRENAVASLTSPLQHVAQEDAVIDYLKRRWPQGAPGTVLVAQDGALVACVGMGTTDQEAGTDAECETAYDIMSMTKQFTASGILKMQMLGMVKVSDAISNYLGHVPRDKRSITVHDLLTHTSGMPESLGDDYEPLSRMEMIEQSMAADLLSKPGTVYHYSNIGYSLLAAIIEIRSGLGYEEFLAKHLFEPAGMAHTGYLIPQWNPTQVAVEYDRQRRPHGRPFEHLWDSDGPYWNLRGNGGLLSTARDILSWHLALEGVSILDQRSKRMMFESHVPENPKGTSHYGYGWVLSPTDYGRLAWHDGGNAWSLGVVARFLEKDSLVFWISNHASMSGDDGWDLRKIEEPLTLGLAKILRG